MFTRFDGMVETFLLSKNLKGTRQKPVYAFDLFFEGYGSI